MDFHDLWQENKRWILGVALGFLVFWVGSSVIGSLYDSGPVARKISSARRALSGEEFFGRSAADAADSERDQITGVRQQLQEALAFEPTEAFRLGGALPPEMQYDEVGRDVRKSVLRSAEDLGVELLSKDLSWPTPNGPQEIESTLVGLCVIRETASRLFAAHDAARAANPDALGLVGIDGLQVVGERRGSERRGRRSRRRSSAVDADELISQVKVRIKLRADEPTILGFLEACRTQQPPISVTTDFKITTGRSPGDPLVVAGTLAAVRIVEQS